MTASQTNAGTPEGPYTQKITFVELRASGVRNVLIAGTTNAATTSRSARTAGRMMRGSPTSNRASPAKLAASVVRSCGQTFSPRKWARRVRERIEHSGTELRRSGKGYGQSGYLFAWLYHYILCAHRISSRRYLREALAETRISTSGRSLPLQDRQSDQGSTHTVRC